jgi:porphobilinogen synthase
MPGVSQISVDGILDQELDRVARAGLRSVILFGIPAAKDAVGSENFDPEGIVQQGIRRIKARHSDLCVITDLCCCEYTSHGHCGVLHGEEVDNDATLEILGRAAQTYAAAGERGLGQLGHGTFPGSAAGKRRTPPT